MPSLSSHYDLSIIIQSCTIAFIFVCMTIQLQWMHTHSQSDSATDFHSHLTLTPHPIILHQPHHGSAARALMSTREEEETATTTSSHELLEARLKRLLHTTTPAASPLEHTFTFGSTDESDLKVGNICGENWSQVDSIEVLTNPGHSSFLSIRCNVDGKRGEWIPSQPTATSDSQPNHSWMVPTGAIITSMDIRASANAGLITSLEVGGIQSTREDGNQLQEFTSSKWPSTLSGIRAGGSGGLVNIHVRINQEQNRLSGLEVVFQEKISSPNL